jgi:hypothetical protein
MTHPLPDTSQPVRQQGSRTPAEQAGEAGSPADEAAQAERLPIHPTTDSDADAQKPGSPAPKGAQKPIRELKPGEPPPESSAGS